MKIKRILSMVLALVLSIGAMSITAFAAEETMYGIGFVNASSLRLRSEPDANSATLVYAPRNDCVVVISKSGEWYKVNYNLQVGYMHQDYLKVLTRENAELGYGEVSGSGVNLRSGPSTTYGKVAVASSGEKCYILGLNNGWYKVIYNGSICYIRSDYLSLTEIPYENQASPNSPKFYRLGKSTGVAPSAAALNGTVSGEAPPLRILLRTLLPSVPHLPLTRLLLPPVPTSWRKLRSIWAPPTFTAALLPAALTAPVSCTTSSSSWASPPTAPPPTSTIRVLTLKKAACSPATSFSLPVHMPAAFPM